MRWLRRAGIALALGLLLVLAAGYLRQRQYQAVEWTSCGGRHAVPCVLERYGTQESSLAYLQPRHELFFIGDIGDGFDEAVGSALERFPDVRTLSIALSHGGLQASALRAARKLNRNGVTVRIDGRCASACATLWASSRMRQARPGAMVGLHDGRFVGDVPAWLRGHMARRARIRTANALRSAGFPEREIERGANTPNEGIHWLDVPTMRRIGVKFETINRP